MIKNRNKARVSFSKAWNYLKNNDVDRALVHINKSIELYPEFIPAHIIYLEIYKHYKKPSNLEQYQQLINQPDSDAFNFIKGLIEENFDNKIQFFKKSLEINDEYFWTLYTINILVHDKPDLSDKIYPIIPHLEKNEIFYFTKGLVDHLDQNLESAIDAYEKSLKINKRYADAHFNLAVAYHDLNNHELALKHYEKTVNYNPYFVDGYYNLGCLYYQNEKYKDSSNFFRKAIEIDPYFAQSYNNLALCYIKMDLLDLAEETIKKALEIDPQFIDALNNYGYILFENKTYQKAIETFKKAIELAPDDNRAHFELGLSYMKLGKVAEFQKELKKAFKVKPDSFLLDNLKNLIK